ncbi:MAG TPA: hypothetical protein PKD12_12915 [Nitrospira sp.]|nr:hypothetical protein [Nitrospira sp.]
MLLALALILFLVAGCATSHRHQPVNLPSRTEHATDQTRRTWTTEREAFYQQAREWQRQAREQYSAAARPTLQHKFRQDYPSLADAEIEALADDALENGFPPEARRRPDGPIRQPPIDFLPPTWRGPHHTNRY